MNIIAHILAIAPLAIVLFVHIFHQSRFNEEQIQINEQQIQVNRDLIKVNKNLMKGAEAQNEINKNLMTLMGLKSGQGASSS